MSADEKTSLTSMDDVMIFRQFDKSEETRRFDVKRKFKFKRVITFGRRRVEAPGERKSCREPSVIVLGFIR